MRINFIAAAAMAFAVTGCMSENIGAEPNSMPMAASMAALNGTELHGRTVIVVMPDGMTARTLFQPDWVSVTSWSNGRTTRAPYRVERQQLCFYPPAGEQGQPECWPYAERLVPGRTYTITAPNGQPARVTLQN